MRYRTARRLGDFEEDAASSAATAENMSLGGNFWTSVGTGVFTGLLVWCMHRALNKAFPKKGA